MKYKISELIPDGLDGKEYWVCAHNHDDVAHANPERNVLPTLVKYFVTEPTRYGRRKNDFHKINKNGTKGARVALYSSCGRYELSIYDNFNDCLKKYKDDTKIVNKNYEEYLSDMVTYLRDKKDSVERNIKKLELKEKM